MRKRMRKDNSGFTLIELLLALGILSVIGMSMAVSLRAGVNAWRLGDEMGRITQEARRVLEDMALEFRHAVPFPGKPSIS